MLFRSPIPRDVAPDPSLPVLILGATRDADRPYAWTGAMARAFPAGRVVTTVGPPDRNAGLMTSSCVDPVVAAYLIDLVLPDADIACPVVR